MTKPDDFEADCKRAFTYYCELYAEAKFHAEKRRHAAKAYEVIDTYLDWVELQSL